MARIWQLQEAKNKLSEVVEEAQKHGLQVITKHGKHSVVVLSYDDYRRLQLSEKKLSEFFRESPLVGVDLDLLPDRSPARDDLAL